MMFFHDQILELNKAVATQMDAFMSGYGFEVSDESQVEENSFSRIYARGRRYVILSAGNYGVDYPAFWKLNVLLKANRISAIDFAMLKKALFGFDSEYLYRLHWKTDDVLLKLKEDLPLYVNDFLEETISERDFEKIITDIFLNEDK